MLQFYAVDAAVIVTRSLGLVSLPTERLALAANHTGFEYLHKKFKGKQV